MTPALTAEEAAETLRMIATMVGEGEAMRDNADDLRAAVDLLLAQSALLAEARACLEPFALAPQDAFLGGGKNSMPAGMPDHSVVPAGVIKWGMVRAAAALHEKLGKMG